MPNSFKFKAEQGEHWLIVGPTGSGKTFFLERLMRRRNYSVVLDSKGELKWKDFSIFKKLEPIETLRVTHAIFRSDATPRLLPLVAEQLFKALYEMRGWTVGIDEVYSLGQHHDFHNLLLTRGRSRGITVVTCSQRPRWFDLFAWTESKHFVLFKLDSDDDLVVVRRQLNQKVADEVAKLKKFEFVYYNKVTGELHHARPLAGV